MVKTRIIITGGSGFIGTNLVEFYCKNNIDVINLDISKPKKKNHMKFWEKVDILNKVELKKCMMKINPDYVIHLAARTDLDGKNLHDYIVNTEGVQNVLDVLKEILSVKKAIFASSMLVCKNGYNPKDSNDYNPDTFYGESKVIGEEIIKNYQIDAFGLIIVRPTSIWGPWFDIPYAQFFKSIQKGRFVKFGNKLCTKTFGYVGNTVHQINGLLFLNEKISKYDIFYLGDSPPLNISDWSDLISKYMGVKKPIRLPFFIVKLISSFGDIVNKLNFNFPLNSTRLSNMTTNNIKKLDNIKKYVNQRYSIEEGIEKTVDWLNKDK